ncbi:MAG: hypothetical protein GX442_21795 [Candidatus Riflebacteria bacterium]|nr:hypothetical protein [Candidatus Riflebacteria bacterium]
MFAVPRPDHFTNHLHCCECAEHDETLRQADLETIGLKELGNAGGDPLCFCSDEGKRYLMPALIRLCLETMDGEFYLAQFLFHLMADGGGNSLFKSCSVAQREFLARVLGFVVLTWPAELEQSGCLEDLWQAMAIWGKA